MSANRRIPFASIIPVSFAAVSATGRGLSLVTTPVSVVLSVMGDLLWSGQGVGDDGRVGEGEGPEARGEEEAGVDRGQPQLGQDHEDSVAAEQVPDHALRPVS